MLSGIWLTVVFSFLCLIPCRAESQTANIKNTAPQVTGKSGDSLEILFTYKASGSEKNVFLAGSFNGWAENQSGAIKNKVFIMEKDPASGLYFRREMLPPKRTAYKFVEETQDGNFNWFADPFVQERDKDGNSVINLSETSHASAPPMKKGMLFSTLRMRELPSAKEPGILLPTRALFYKGEKICFSFEPPTLTLPRKGGGNAKEEFYFRVLNALGSKVYEKRIKIPLRKNPPYSPFSKGGDIRIPPLEKGEIQGDPIHKNGEMQTKICMDASLPEGGYIVQLWKGKTLLAEEATSVVGGPEEDVRYGFYATWTKVYSEEEYSERAKQFLRYHVNAVQFYDWFPAHGKYAPDQDVYEFDPFFGKKIYRNDILGKIKGLHKYGIFPMAYVAPYASSRSVYKDFPFPMRYEDGSIRVFSSGGRQESENSAKDNHRDVWFYLMSIHPGSPWREHILEELKGAERLGFDGFHVDSYGHGNSEKYYGTGESPWNGKNMTEVLALLVKDIRNQTHDIKPRSLVAFNSVSGFALEEMCPVEDFTFVENWAGHSSYLDELAELAFSGPMCSPQLTPHLNPPPQGGRNEEDVRGKRMVIALYPKDTDQKPEVWSEQTLRLILGAAQAGGGSLIVLGEPNLQGRSFNSLSDLYYPNHKQMPDSSLKIVHDFYNFDQLMYGLTHGAEVRRKRLPFPPSTETISYEYASPVRNTRTFTLYRRGANKKWTEANTAIESIKNSVMAFPGKAGKAYFATPEIPAYRNPVEVPFSSDGENTWVKVPELNVFGVVILTP